MNDEGESTPITASIEHLLRLAESPVPSGEFAQALLEFFRPVRDQDSELGPLVKAVAWHERALFVAEAEADRIAWITLEDRGPEQMTPVPGTPFHTHVATIETGRAHNYGIRVDGRPLGLALSPHSVAGYGPESYPAPGVPNGWLSQRRTLVSDIYDGAEVEYWTYANVGADTGAGAPVMVWLDGRGMLGVSDALGGRMQTVTDNLVHLGRIPPMVHLLVSPASGGRRTVPVESYHTRFADFRILQYDEISDEFVRHLVEEILPEVQRHVPIRQDAYSRAIVGGSSGGTCAFKVGWFAPDAFSRLYPYCASFTAWGWRPDDGIDGAQVLPLWVRGSPRRNLRIWLSAGVYDDFDADPPEHLAFQMPDSPGFRDALRAAGSQALGQLEMAQALRGRGYDYRFRYGTTGHNGAQFGLELPEALTWLWRAYDPARQHETFEPEGDGGPDREELARLVSQTTTPRR